MAQPQAPTPSRRSRRKWPFVLLGIAALIVIIAVASGGKDTGTQPGTVAAPTSTTGATDAATQTQAPPPAPAEPANSIGPGTYVVGKEVQAGTYHTTGPADASVPICYWARLKDTSGDMSAIITNGTPQGPTTVTISKGDGAFETSGCATWTKTH